MQLLRPLLMILGLGAAVYELMKRRRYKAPPPQADDPVEMPDDSATLLENLRDSNWRVRRSAVLKLGELNDPATLPEMIALLEDKDSDVREAAVGAVAAMKPASEPLVKLLHDGNLDTRVAAAQTLALLGDKAAIPDLIDALNDESMWVRQPVVQALGATRSAKAIPALVKALTDEDSGVRQAARDALIAIGTPDALKALPK